MDLPTLQPAVLKGRPFPADPAHRAGFREPGLIALAILSLIVLFVVGGLLLTRVDVERGRRIAEDENARVRALAR